jgi:outer membrane autotransporter protein
MLRLLSCLAIALAAAPASAQTVFIADLRGSSENPPVASPASGSALVLFDPAFQTMIVRTTFSGLTTPTVDAHIHCCAPPTANAIVAVGFRPTGFPLGVTAGQFSSSFDLNNLATYNPPFVAANGGTAASARTRLISGTQGGLAYVNIHTTRFPGGEIRGQLLTGGDLTPQAYSLLPEVALQTAEFQDSTLRRYLRDVRGAGEGLNGQTAALGDDGKIGMFLIAGGRYGEFEERANRPRVDLGSAGVMAGLDFRLGPASRVGLMTGYDSSDVRLTPHSRQSGVKSWFGGAYGSLALGPAYVDLHASYGKSDHDLFRRISVGAFQAESVAEADSEYWMLAGTAGLSVQASGFEIEPYVGARYVDLDLDAFTEGGNIAAQTIGATGLESLQSIAGLRLGADIPAGAASVRPSIRAEWRHEFNNDDARLITGSFGGAGAFAFATTPLSDDHWVVGAGFSISGGGPLSLATDYTGQLTGGYRIHALTGGVRLAF